MPKWGFFPKLSGMNKEVVKIFIRAVIPTNNGCALFLGDDEKVFVIYVDQHVGNLLNMAMNQESHERPLTHDLMHSLLLGLEAKVERVIINDARDGTFFARLIVKMENEIDTKLIELDARPSDSIILGVLQEAPLFVTREVLEEAEDMSSVLAQILAQPDPGEDADEEDKESPF